MHYAGPYKFFTWWQKILFLYTFPRMSSDSNIKIIKWILDTQQYKWKPNKWNGNKVPEESKGQLRRGKIINEIFRKQLKVKVVLIQGKQFRWSSHINKSNVLKYYVNIILYYCYIDLFYIIIIHSTKLLKLTCSLSLSLIHI